MNDSEFKAALNQLSAVQQRQVGALFLYNVRDLSSDKRIERIVKVAQQADIDADELEQAFKAAKAAAVESFTRCGSDTDWQAQAEHFVARAAEACLQAGGLGNPAWNAAMRARMARNCATIAAGEGTEAQETQQQYQLLATYMEQNA